MRNYSSADLAALLPYPAQDANKYSRGQLVLVAGSAEFPGAAALAATAALRMGAGYTQVYVESSVVGVVQGFAPALVVRAWDALDTTATVVAHEDRPKAYVVGCGFAPGGEVAQQLALRLLELVQVPVLVDGGALRALATEEGRRVCAARAAAGFPLVITPHAGEAAKLAWVTGIEETDPVALVQELAGAYGAICVLKGPQTFISDGQGAYCMDEGTAALAKAGTGDVLAGMIGALLAQDLPVADACVLGTHLHALSGKYAAQQFSSIAVVPEDVIAAIPQAIQSL